MLQITLIKKLRELGAGEIEFDGQNVKRVTFFVTSGKITTNSDFKGPDLEFAEVPNTIQEKLRTATKKEKDLLLYGHAMG